MDRVVKVYIAVLFFTIEYVPDSKGQELKFDKAVHSVLPSICHLLYISWIETLKVYILSLCKYSSLVLLSSKWKIEVWLRHQFHYPCKYVIVRWVIVCVIRYIAVLKGLSNHTQHSLNVPHSCQQECVSLFRKTTMTA